MNGGSDDGGFIVGNMFIGNKALGLSFLMWGDVQTEE